MRKYEVRVTYTVDVDEEIESEDILELYERREKDDWDSLIEDAEENCSVRHVSVERLL